MEPAAATVSRMDPRARARGSTATRTAVQNVQERNSPVIPVHRSTAMVPKVLAKGTPRRVRIQPLERSPAALPGRQVDRARAIIVNRTDSHLANRSPEGF